MNKRKYLIVIIIVICLFISATTFAHTNDLTGSASDYTMKFRLYSTTYHLGSSSTTYRFEPADLGDEDIEDYTADLLSAVSKWGGTISLTLSSNSSNKIYHYALPSTVYASTQYPSYNHDSSWYIKVNASKFDTITASQRAKIFAHELGHAFGLAHSSYSSEAMYYAYQNPLANPTTQDKWGMKNCTDSHTSHSFDSNFVNYDMDYHSERCTVCKGLKLYSHTHDGNYTYYNSYYHTEGCTVCDGVTYASHVYDGNGICIYCYGIQ